jgi:hypothetical protein
VAKQGLVLSCLALYLAVFIVCLLPPIFTKYPDRWQQEISMPDLSTHCPSIVLACLAHHQEKYLATFMQARAAHLLAS